MQDPPGSPSSLRQSHQQPPLWSSATDEADVKSAASIGFGVVSILAYVGNMLAISRQLLAGKTGLWIKILTSKLDFQFWHWLALFCWILVRWTNRRNEAWRIEEYWTSHCQICSKGASSTNPWKSSLELGRVVGLSSHNLESRIRCLLFLYIYWFGNKCHFFILFLWVWHLLVMPI